MEKNNRNLRIRKNDVEICYDDFGESEIPLIFIHGFPFDKSTWQSQLDELKSQFRVIAYDCRGFGKSTSGNKSYSMDLFADDLIMLMDELKISKANICGLSMGGYVALNVINRFPERVHKLVLADTQCNGDNEEGKEKRYKAIEFLNNGGISQYTDTLIKNLFFESSFQKKPHLITQIKSIIISTQLHSITSTLKALAERSDSCDILSKIENQTLVICGKEDATIPLVKSEFLHDNIKNSKLKIIENAGHVCNMEQPAEFNKLLIDFIQNN